MQHAQNIMLKNELNTTHQRECSPYQSRKIWSFSCANCDWRTL